MTINPHVTDQMLAAFDASRIHSGCNTECPFERAARDIAEMLTTELPGADPRIIGEIVMHAGAAMVSTLKTSHRSGLTWRTAATGSANSLLEAGTLLYRATGTEAGS